MAIELADKSWFAVIRMDDGSTLGDFQITYEQFLFASEVDGIDSAPTAILGPSHLNVYPVTLNSLMNLRHRDLKVFESDADSLQCEEEDYFEVMGHPEVPGLYPYLLSKLNIASDKEKLLRGISRYIVARSWGKGYDFGVECETLFHFFAKRDLPHCLSQFISPLPAYVALSSHPT